MLERIYKYRVTCDGRKQDGCDGEVEYETVYKNSLPNGWEVDDYTGSSGTRYINHYCPKCRVEWLKREMAMCSGVGKGYWESQIKDAIEYLELATTKAESGE